MDGGEFLDLPGVPGVGMTTPGRVKPLALLRVEHVPGVAGVAPILPVKKEKVEEGKVLVRGVELNTRHPRQRAETRVVTSF